MKILAFDTATENCSSALLLDDEIIQLCENAPQQHAKLLLPMIEQLLAGAGVSKRQLDGVVFGRGPGSFTGLRIAAAAAQGMALGLDLPVAGVSTLQAIAHQCYRLNGDELTLACIDARMSQVYWAAYETKSVGDSQLLGEESVADPHTVNLPDDRIWAMAGTGLKVCVEHQADVIARLDTDSAGSRSKKINLNTVLPEAHDMLLLAKAVFEQGQGVSAEQAIPVYLRDKVALTEAERAAQKNPAG